MLSASIQYVPVNAKASLLSTGGFRTFNKIDTKKKSHCCPLGRASYEKGFGALFIGGTNVESRVTIYRPAPIPASGMMGIKRIQRKQNK